MKYIVFPNIAISQVSGATASFELQNPRWISGGDFRKPLFSVQEQRSRTSNDNLVIEGKVVNQDTISFPKVSVVAIFQGKLGQPVAASITEIDRLGPNETKSFVITHPATSQASASIPKIFIYSPRP